MNQSAHPFARALPSLLTLAGHLATIAWLAGGPWWLALLGLALDVADGAVARRLGTCTEAGGLYDWLVDTTTAAILAARISPWLLIVMVPAQAVLRQRGLHFCGRALLQLGVLAWQAAAA